MDGQISSEKERYKQKLESVGLTLSNDPFMKDNDHRFSDDMSLWPRIEYGNIFGYFINRPGTYTQEQLLSWKQLEAYNYFESGFVRTVFAMGFGQGDQKCCLLIIIARSSGLIVPAHCTCMTWLVKLIFPRVHARCI